ncbi:hypothetical protein RJ640_013574 [Escallonia rubra]|uniref:Carotenoid oxygenase n=1 Tax=Escallonia rubra TaxID=112253 RepID=A0AA88UCS2_9ASTE|nr:hypothetical protein RJ640_013574 [Escallonia rubra]
MIVVSTFWQSNFAPVEEMGEAVLVSNVNGAIPDDFPEGVYIRNGPNPLFGGLKSTNSMFGRSSHIWVEGEGMLHAVYFNKDSGGSWTICYNNRHVQTETFKLERGRQKPSFLPAIKGNSPAILSAFILNMLRFGKINKYISNTNVFEHSGKFYSIAESDLPQEIDIVTLETLGNWDINGAWKRPFTSHPKKAPVTGEMLIMGVDAKKPFFELGVISADGKRLLHKVDLNLSRCSLCHDIGVTQRYNVIIDFPLTLDLNRLIRGRPIGVMPRYGDANSVCWFDVKRSSAFHVFNCFEDGDEVIMWACRARGSIIPGPDLGLEKHEWFSRGFKHTRSVENNSDNPDGLFFSRAYEWRLNMTTGEVVERNLTGTEFSMDFPMINENVMGVKNQYGYSQVVDSTASSTSGMAKYRGLAKLYFEEPELGSSAEPLLSPSSEVSMKMMVGSSDSYTMKTLMYLSCLILQVYRVDTKKFSSEPVATITLPRRVPYGFHGAFMPLSSPRSTR